MLSRYLLFPKAHTRVAIVFLGVFALDLLSPGYRKFYAFNELQRTAEQPLTVLRSVNWVIGGIGQPKKPKPSVVPVSYTHQDEEGESSELQYTPVGDEPHVPPEDLSPPTCQTALSAYTSDCEDDN